jgi:hypothetical protein
MTAAVLMDDEIPIYTDDASIKDAEQKKHFAREQYEFLRSKYTDPIRIRRIFKAAGPGQVKEAWNLATSEDWETQEGKLRLDILDCILTGAGGMREFSWERIKKVLAYNDFYVPESRSHYSFLRILDGALEILFPGCFPFTDEEIAEIERRN